MNNNYNNFVPPVLLLYNDTPGVVLEEDQLKIAQFPSNKINLKQINIRTIKKVISVPEEAGHINNTVVWIFLRIQCLQIYVF